LKKRKKTELGKCLSPGQGAVGKGDREMGEKAWEKKHVSQVMHISCNAKKRFESRKGCKETRGFKVGGRRTDIAEGGPVKKEKLRITLL